MKIAIIGTGISGLTCGYRLHKNHDVTLFEANDYIGGHTATVDVEVEGKPYTVDTGFIVYNDRTYPNFIEMMNEIGVRGNPTEMSFSVRNDGNGLEYNGHALSTLFAQKRNWFNPKFYSFISEILRFNKLAKSLADDDSLEDQTLGSFLEQQDFSDYFSENYILPMGAAIWSSTLADMRVFPLSFFLRFFLNHGLLDIKNRPQWYVIDGGSRAYIEPLTQGFSDKILLNSPVEKVQRTPMGVRLLVNGEWLQFDQVIFACHSDQALKILGEEQTQLETDVLGDMRYQANEVVLHTDTNLLPKRNKAWASWNYYLSGDQDQENRLPTLTYDMNILQHIQSEHTFCVSLNNSPNIDKNKILRSFIYHHPVFTRESIAAQGRSEELQGNNATWFCGAYWRNGFHEDGVHSALQVVKGIEALQENVQEKGAA
ncbi:NAD(P)/FAD-dependent oxidoreductase [Vibrio breoganii]|uniref:NAD(P)/FAD-dependent oxidoreductase n=1 Tax=Vibrio breoganii TaxID=553239 RepID=UPI000C836395|nr:NAD(P)/FAD-dependent oxidoreductase [Vibrio breoganii]PMG41668.1 FAD-dependent oxidoreductase [Vibrio breoganii]PML61618.1 FAD-dependent oxidoreductase [Vibrio breoganii]PML93664.1 FAD-dependent oxidoreductase [Vibrio breoganii]PMM17665.1 FAD-dependent oxidoreductase [Vibrio breoganii]PMN57716.1 FAD-dependent oxidoreductase [Vibrio breoganii]